MVTARGGGEFKAAKYVLFLAIQEYIDVSLYEREVRMQIQLTEVNAVMLGSCATLEIN